MITAPVTARPVADAERISALDVARGIALLGILTVNIHYFGWPLGDVMGSHSPPKDADAPEFAAWYYFRTLGEGKFFTVFSMLFGAGLTIQWARARERGLGFGVLAFRRLGFLMALGLCHALLLWYGDILFVYAWVGLLMLVPLVWKWTARTQVVVAACLVVVASLLWGGVSAVQGWGERAAQQQVAAPVAAPTGSAKAHNEATGFDATPFGRLVDHWQHGQGSGSPDDPVWRENEVLAYRNGPWLQAFFFRAMTWLSMLVMMLFGFGVSVVAMFLIGSAMVKADIFRTAPDRFFARWAAAGFGVGLPLSIASTAMLSSPRPWIREFLSSALFLPAGAAVAIGTISLVTLWTRSGRASGLARVIGNTGRLGLTNYLLQTVVCTFVFYHWGLGKFGTMGGPALLGIAVGVWVFQVALSNIAVRYLAYGPMEWLWRSVTYWRLQPFLRRAVGGAPPSPGTPVASIPET